MTPGITPGTAATPTARLKIGPPRPRTTRRAALIEPDIVVRPTTLNSILEGDHINGEHF
jgi:hypothetical protein